MKQVHGVPGGVRVGVGWGWNGVCMCVCVCVGGGYRAILLIPKGILFVHMLA